MRFLTPGGYPETHTEIRGMWGHCTKPLLPTALIPGLEEAPGPLPFKVPQAQIVWYFLRGSKQWFPLQFQFRLLLACNVPLTEIIQEKTGITFLLLAALQIGTPGCVQAGGSVTYMRFIRNFLGHS
jgi:hypothetical protein